LTKKASKAALYGTSVDIHQTVEEDPMIAALHERAEKFDERAEHVFGYLQVGVTGFGCSGMRFSGQLS
jgi:sodium-dependent phosphate transporter